MKSAQAIEPLEPRTLLSAGDLDFTFGKGGIVTQSLDHDAQLPVVAVESDKRIVVAFVGDFRSTTARLTLERFMSSGKLDTSFGHSGSVSVRFDGTPGSKLVIDDSGRILILAGNDLFRFTSSGALDSTFGNHGLVRMPGLSDFAITTGHKITLIVANQIKRLLTDGEPDSSFGTHKIASINVTTPTDLGDVSLRTTGDAIEPDGSLLFTLNGGDSMSGEIQGAIVRMTSFGKIDKEFGFQGVAEPNTLTDEIALDVGVTLQGKILVLSETDSGATYLTELNSNGQPDTSFGDGQFDNSTSFDAGDGDAVFATSSGKIIVECGDPEFAEPVMISRLNADGTYDPTFGPFGSRSGLGGETTLQAGRFAPDFTAVAPNQDIVFAAITDERKLTLIRLEGSPPTKPLAALAGGVLTVNGTGKADDITVDEDSGVVTVTVNDKQVSFSSKSVKSILVNAGAGNDTIVVETTIGGPTTILGGAGNDNILGIGEHEVINGGAGDDTLRCARDGFTTFIGGPGNDTADFSQFASNLTITLDNKPNDGSRSGEMNVESDIENVIGGSGNDLIIGNPSFNHLYGGPGNDTLYGGGGNDTLEGGHGHDQLFGQDGDDLLIARDGTRDTVDGGDGFDRASRDLIDFVSNIESFAL